MNETLTDNIELVEYIPKTLERDAIPEEVARLLWRSYPDQLDIEPPGFTNNYQWQLKSKGWVGYIPLPGGFGITLQPKVSIQNLFRMWRYAYRLEGIQFPAGLFQSQSLQDFYEDLAAILAERVLLRTRNGLYREYIPHTDHLPFVRGRIDTNDLVRAPWKVNLLCHYEDHTPDIEDNQILAWTLFTIAHSGLCSDRTLPTILKAYRGLQGYVGLYPFSSEDCLGRLYARLNFDYQPLHALCRFFLERTGPTHQLGSRTMLPFLMDMAALFELFVAEWLNVNLPSTLSLKTQAHTPIGHNTGLSYRIDLVLSDTATQQVFCVLDTKYKAPDRASTDDINQAVAYATIKGCRDAFLVYPTDLPRPLNVTIGDIRIRSLTYSLDGDLEQAGQTFKSNLLRSLSRA